MNFVRNALPDAVDGTGGGTFNLLPAHTLHFTAGGGNIVFDAPFSFSQAEVPLAGTLDIFGRITVDSGGFIDLLANSVSALRVESGAKIEVFGGGTIQLDASAILLARNGSILTLNGVATLGDAGGGGSNGHLLVGDVSGSHPGAIFVTSQGSVTFQASSLATWAAGSNALFTGASTVCTFQSGAGLTMAGSAAAALFGNEVDLNGPIFQVGVYTRAGSTGYTIERVTTVTPGGGVDIADPRTKDVWLIGGGGGQIGLGTPGGAVDGVRTTFVIQSGANAVVDFYQGTIGGGVKILRMNPANSPLSGITPVSIGLPAIYATFMLSGGVWVLIEGSGPGTSGAPMFATF